MSMIVFVKSFSVLSPQPPGGDHSSNGNRTGVLGVIQLPKQGIASRNNRVHPDEIQQSKRPHGKAQGHFHDDIDGFPVSDVFFQPAR
jgi:hypothetical protein